MSDLESFSGFDQSNSMDPAAFERFKERMAAAAAQLKAIQAGEQKQKKKEDELVKILLRFIKTGQKHDILLLVSRLLEQNIPASFIVSILLINNSDIQQELGLKLLPAGMLDESNFQPQSQSASAPGGTSPKSTSAQPPSLIQTLPDRYMEDQALPLKIKIAIDAWIQEMVKYAFEKPYRLLETAIDANGLIKLPLLQLTILCLEDFLTQHAVETNYESLKNFMAIMLEGIIKRVQEQTRNRKELKEGKPQA